MCGKDSQGIPGPAAHRNGERFWAEQGLMPPLIPQGICSAPLALRMPFLRTGYCPIIESMVFSSELSIKSPATVEFSPGWSAKECLLILLRCSTSFQIPLDLRFSSGFVRLLWQYPDLGVLFWGKVIGCNHTGWLTKVVLFCLHLTSDSEKQVLSIGSSS